MFCTNLEWWNIWEMLTWKMKPVNVTNYDYWNKKYKWRTRTHLRSNPFRQICKTGIHIIVLRNLLNIYQWVYNDRSRKVKMYNHKFELSKVNFQLIKLD